MDFYILDEALSEEREDDREHEESISKTERETQINRNLIYSDKYVKAIQSLNESPKCTRVILDCSRKMLDHHNGDKYEDLYFIDAATSKYKFRDDYRSHTHKVEPTKEMIKMLENNSNIIGIHNHPNSLLPSLSDFHSCEKRNYKYGIVLCHNGSIFQYKNIRKLNDINIEIAIHIFEKEEYISLTSLQTYEDIKNAHIRHLKELEKNLKEAGIDFREVLYNER